MNKCKKDHGKGCELKSGTSNTPNLRLIDCATREIRPHEEGDTYVALSYCWGTPQASQADGMGTPFRLPQHLPATIEDAILATQKLGIQYIWIDRYCVPQGAGDPGRNQQISLMHKIYMGAEVTIIAAAGDSPTYGLPGVTRERRKLPQIHFGSHTLIATLPDPRILIASSKWSTRGWTYQEGLLSRRRLVFTDQQVYFQCNKYEPGPMGMPDDYYGCSEAMSLSSASIDPCNILEDDDGFFEFELDHFEIWPRINEYTQRSLSRQEDIMNAMLGIFEKYAERKSMCLTFRHIFGIPISYMDGLENHEADSWQGSFLLNLAWELPTPSKRRKGFPSWSWVGWEGTGFVGSFRCLYHLCLSCEQHIAAVHVEQDDRMPAANMDLLHWKIPHIIFDCLSVPLHIKNISQCPPPWHDRQRPPLENELDLRVLMQIGNCIHSYNFQLLPRDLAEKPGLDKGIPCVGLLLDPPVRKYAPHSQYCTAVVLLVMESQQRTGTEKTGQLYERIGKAVIPNEHLEGVSDKRGYFTVG